MHFGGRSNAHLRLYKHSRAEGTDGSITVKRSKSEIVDVGGFETQAKTRLSEQVFGESVLPGHGKHEAG